MAYAANRGSAGAMRRSGKPQSVILRRHGLQTKFAAKKAANIAGYVLASAVNRCNGDGILAGFGRGHSGRD